MESSIITVTSQVALGKQTRRPVLAWQIAIVVSGGGFGGVFGLGLSTFAAQMIPSHRFIGTYFFITVANLLHLTMLTFVKLDDLLLRKIMHISFYRNSFP